MKEEVRIAAARGVVTAEVATVAAMAVEARAVVKSVVARVVAARAVGAMVEARVAAAMAAGMLAGVTVEAATAVGREAARVAVHWAVAAVLGGPQEVHWEGRRAAAVRAAVVTGVATPGR